MDLHVTILIISGNVAGRTEFIQEQHPVRRPLCALLKKKQNAA
jgi:hypothetical protein